MRWVLGVLAVVILLGWGAYRLWQEPRVRELFGVSEARALPTKNRLVVLRRGPAAGYAPVNPAPPPLPNRGIASAPVPDLPAASAGAAETVEAPPAARNSVDNATVQRVLLQVLASKHLAYGVWLTVTDDAVRVGGIVASEESRRSILDIIEKARESRQVDARQLTVGR